MREKIRDRQLEWKRKEREGEGTEESMVAVLE